jgi:itaconate CoA-transferase
MNHYHAEYQRKLTTADQAVEKIRDDETIFYGMSVAQPPALLSALADRGRAGDVRGLKIYTFLPLEHAHHTVLDPVLSDVFQNYSMFVGKSDRSMVRTGLAYYVPSYLHQAPRLISEFIKADTTLTTVSPMDDHGYFTFGTSNDCTSAAARSCKRLIVEVNENMPRVFGDSLIHISQVDTVIENHVPLLEFKIPPAHPEDDIIGPMIAEMVPDGASIQLGVGGLPNAVARYLAGHRDLGVHTELFTEGMYELILKGVITGRKKNLHYQKNVYTTAAGTKEMYAFMNNNPTMESYPANYVCDPFIIGRNDNLISINSVLEVDLLGQANAEFLDQTTFSGTGGQLDFVRGAFNSKGGKSILAFYSTAKEGTISRVVPRLDTGAVVTTPRTDAHYLVTEYGVVDLKGKSTRERALDIISIAHPAFRDALLKEAENMYIL